MFSKKWNKTIFLQQRFIISDFGCGFAYAKRKKYVPTFGLFLQESLHIQIRVCDLSMLHYIL